MFLYEQSDQFEGHPRVSLNHSIGSVDISNLVIFENYLRVTLSYFLKHRGSSKELQVNQGSYLNHCENICLIPICFIKLQLPLTHLFRRWIFLSQSTQFRSYITILRLIDIFQNIFTQDLKRLTESYLCRPVRTFLQKKGLLYLLVVKRVERYTAGWNHSIR